MTHEEHDTQAEEDIKRIVEEYGWFVGAFEANTATPAFAYTIGLWKNFRHPEIISFGLSTELLHSIINEAGNMVKEGKGLALDKDNHEILDNFPVQFKTVHPDNIPDYFGYGRWYYDYEDFPAIQLIWPDKSGKYPWEEDFNADLKFNQPLLYNKLDFKFFEERNVTAFVAKQIFKEDKPILIAQHDFDGDWQFLTGELVTQDDIMMVALEQVVKKDPGINQLFNMPAGQRATREQVGGEWIREELAEPEEEELS